MLQLKKMTEIRLLVATNLSINLSGFHPRQFTLARCFLTSVTATKNMSDYVSIQVKPRK